MENELNKIKRKGQGRNVEDNGKINKAPDQTI